jgi:putative endonuclease
VLALLRLWGRRPACQLDYRRLGRAGERAAARMLKRKGYRVLGRNLNVRVRGGGEADILCLAPDRATVVLVEVKTRLRGSGRSLLGELVAPERSVGVEKRRKLRALLATLARANGWTGRPMRIDVVAVEWPAARGKPELRHHEGIRV